MQTSVIRHRVADFLKRFAPFDAFTEEDLLDLAGSGKVKFHESEEYIFRQGDAEGPLVWIIQQGRVELLEGDSGEQLRDVVGEGDLLGLDRFFGDGRCRHSARTASDVILYGVPAARLESLLSRYPALKRFLAAHFSVAGILGFGRTSWLDAEPPPPEFLRTRLRVLPPEASMAEAALCLIGSPGGIAAVIDDAGRPAGILTPLDVCAAGEARAGAAARPGSPTASPALTTRTAVREMLRARTGELAITADGTANSRLEGILTASELALFCGHNPAHILGAIRGAASAAEIVPLLRQARRLVLDGLAQPRDIDDCCRIGAEVIAALAEACIRLAAERVLAAGVDPPGAPCCWLLFGESARGHRLEPGLPTIAAVYDDSAEGCRPEDSVYFTALAGETLAWFHACGLAGASLSWPEGSQPSMPLSEWKRLYSETLRHPVDHDLYSRREFFDMRALCGNPAILHKLREHIRLELEDEAVAIPLLANDTLANLPPLTFFQGLVVELDGTRQESFEIGATAISPIGDAARVFALAGRRLAPADTLERLRAAATGFPEAAGILRDASDAFRIALYYQAIAGGRIQPGDLGKFDQRLLKTAFSSIQRLLEFTASAFIPDA